MDTVIYHYGREIGAIFLDRNLEILIHCLKYAYPLKYSLWNLLYRDVCTIEQEYIQGYLLMYCLVCNGKKKIEYT